MLYLRQFLIIRKAIKEEGGVNLCEIREREKKYERNFIITIYLFKFCIYLVYILVNISTMKGTFPSFHIITTYYLSIFRRWMWASSLFHVL